MASVLDSGGGVRYTPPKKVAPLSASYNAAQAEAARRRVLAANNTPNDRAEAAAIQAMVAGGNSPYTPGMGGSRAVNTPAVTNYRVQGINATTSALQSLARGLPTAPTSGGPSLSSGRSGGGGGGGKAAAPMMSQAMIDWIAELMRSGAPGAEQFSAVDLPDYQQVAYRDFDPTMFNQNRTALGAAGQQDLSTINQSQADLRNFLTSNYRNAYADPNVGTGGQPLGDTQQDLIRLLASQGVNTTTPGQQSVANEAARAQAMAGDWRQAMSANEEQAQRNRLSANDTRTTQNQLALQALQRSLGLGIDQTETQARGQWQSAADQWNEAQRQAQYQAQQQEALANWQRQNQVTDTNTQNTASYRNQVLQSLLALAQGNVGNNGITLPSMAALGLG